MRADDAFRRALHDTVRDIGAYVDGLRDVADVAVSESADHWRVLLAPRGAAACPVELILHACQTFDIALGGEVYEDQPLNDPAQISLVLRAIVEGHVRTRVWSTLATGARHTVETIVTLPDGGNWSGGRRSSLIGELFSREACSVTDRHYVPYRTAGARQAA